MVKDLATFMEMDTAPANSPVPPTATPSDTPLPPKVLCSPLAGYSLSQLEAAINNPYHPPKTGFDDPHHGIDFAVIGRGSEIALAGSPVQAVLKGMVAAVVRDRFPYGNALLIETPLEMIPEAVEGGLALPTLAPTVQPQPALTCPAIAAHKWDFSRRSVYLLYAHLLEPPPFELGDQAECGQTIGAIGSSGNALNPHLHLETRLGPAGSSFDSLAHYDSSATAAEMDNYCTWRVRGVFQMFDPMTLLHFLP